MKYQHLFRKKKYLLPSVMLLGFGWISPSLAFIEPPNQVQIRLEACRNGGNIPILNGSDVLPNVDGNYTCQDPNVLGGNDTPYTNGNLGKGWNELDLVPHRLIVENNENTAETYDVYIAADNEDDAGILGYDQIVDVQVITSSAPDNDTQNLFSDPSCEIVVGPQLIDTSGTITGGIDNVIYRQVTITHDAGTTCVIDWANRLAIGASQYPGSSLQSYKFESENFQNGKETISIQVDETTLFGLSKSMSATFGAGQVWDLNKSLDTNQLNLGDTCDTSPKSGDVKVTVEWSVKPASGNANAVTVETTITATNNLFREVLVDIEDEILGNIGNGEVSLDTANFDDVTVPAQDQVSRTHTFDILNVTPEQVVGLRDEATATFKDPVLQGSPVIGEQVMANFELVPNGDGIQIVSEALPNADITETESFTGTGLSYVVTNVTNPGEGFSPDATDGNNPITPLSGDVVWQILNQNPDDCDEGSTCSVEITKTITAEPFATVNGTLSDWATLEADIEDSNESILLTSGTEEAPFTVNITGAPLVDLSVMLTVPTLQAPDTLQCVVEVSDSSQQVVGTLTYDFSSTLNSDTKSLFDLSPDTYTATVTQCGDLVGATQMDADLTLTGEPLTNADCSDTLAFEFTAPEPELPVYVEVNKVTHPVGLEDGWIMTLEGGDLQAPVILETSDSDNSAFERFQGDDGDLELGEGAYTITETLKDGWVQTASTGCVFTVTAEDAGSVKQCTFTNKKLGKIIIHKETKPKYGTGFTFLHDIDYTNEFTLDHGQSQTFYDVVPGSYQVEESDPAPDFKLTKLTCTESVTDNSQTDKATRVASIELDPGEVVECTFTNRENGMVVVKKLTNGYPTEDEWKFTLSGPGVDTYALTPPNTFDFDGTKLTPKKTYTLCEVDVPFGWIPVWFVDSDKDGYADQKLDLDVKSSTGRIIKGLGASNVFIPNADQKPDLKGDMTFCVTFKVKPGQTLHFKVDNVQFKKPEDPKPEPPKDKCHDEPIYGQYLSHDYFQSSDDWVGYYHVDDCYKASKLLKRKVSSSNSDYLASKLYKAKLHQYFGKASCDSADYAMVKSHQMLEVSGYSGEGYKFSSKLRREAKRLAKDLDSYLSNKLCP